MKRFVIVPVVAAAIFAGCATSETGRVTRTEEGLPAYGLDDQPQTAIAGDGSLMPGAYGSRQLPTGQFTGRERTNDMIGQRPVPPREADPRALAHDDHAETGKGAGTLGQSGVVPGEPVTAENLLETEEIPSDAPTHAVVIPPGSETPVERQESVGNPPPNETGTEAGTNNEEDLRPEN